MIFIDYIGIDQGPHVIECVQRSGIIYLALISRKLRPLLISVKFLTVQQETYNSEEFIRSKDDYLKLELITLDYCYLFLNTFESFKPQRLLIVFHRSLSDIKST